MSYAAVVLRGQKRDATVLIDTPETSCSSVTSKSSFNSFLSGHHLNVPMNMKVWSLGAQVSRDASEDEVARRLYPDLPAREHFCKKDALKRLQYLRRVDLQAHREWQEANKTPCHKPPAICM